MFGKAHEDLEMKAKKSIPGPGQYNPLSDVLKKHEPNFKVGT